MRLHLLGLLVGFALGLAGYVAFTPSASAASPPGPSPYQPNADIYEIPGYPSPTLQTLNPLTVKLKAGERIVRFRWQVVSGCYAGNMRDTLQRAMDSTTRVTGVHFIEVASGYDLTIRASCGQAFTSVCPGVGVIACLGRGFPYVDDIDAVSTMATFYELSQVSIWEHELAGHAMETAAEGYLLNGSFGSAPGYVSYMNTGPLSRYDWPENDVNRWWRTMWTPLTVAPPDCASQGFDPCTGRWYAPDGWSYDGADGSWWAPDGVREWEACDFSWHGRHNVRSHGWYHEGTSFFLDAAGSWRTAPAC